MRAGRRQAGLPHHTGRRIGSIRQRTRRHSTKSFAASNPRIRMRQERMPPDHFRRPVDMAWSSRGVYADRTGLLCRIQGWRWPDLASWRPNRELRRL